MIDLDELEIHWLENGQSVLVWENLGFGLDLLPSV